MVKFQIVQENVDRLFFSEGTFPLEAKRKWFADGFGLLK